jgi:hypothetical protein
MKIIQEKNLPLEGRDAAPGFGRLLDNRFILPYIVHDHFISGRLMIDPH